MIPSPNRFALPCAGPFHKINTGCEATTTTTVNSSCLRYGYYFAFRCHFTKLIRDKGAALRMYACVYCICVLYANPEKYWNKCKNHSLNEYGCRDAPCKKLWKQGNPLSNTIKDTSTIMRTPSLHDSGKGLRMIVLVSLIVLLRGFPCFHDFLHGAFPTSIFIQ